MLKITISVPEDRNAAGIAELSDGGETLLEEMAVASVDARTAKRLGNARCDPLRPAGHPPTGRYELAARGATPPGAQGEYGNTLLLFEPRSGQALEAEAHGRLGLLVYAGARGRDVYPRRTQGGVRLTQGLMQALLSRLDADTEVELHVRTIAPRPWWAFWRKALATTPFSKDGPLIDAPPLDETTLAATLAKTALRPQRTAQVQEDDDDRHRRSRDDDTRSSSSSEREFKGGGGTGGGGGASGGWTDAPAAGRGPGVDAAGRVIAAAGVAAVAASVAAHAAGRSSDEPAMSDPGISDTGPSSGDGDASSSIDTSASTSY